jgi:hypothetical protein
MANIKVEVMNAKSLDSGPDLGPLVTNPRPRAGPMALVITGSLVTAQWSLRHYITCLTPANPLPSHPFFCWQGGESTHTNYTFLSPGLGEEATLTYLF